MEFIPSLLLFASIAAITPGPNNIMIMSSGLNFGLRASLPHYFGICCGFPVMLTAVGLGAGYVFEQYPWVHRTLQIVGVSYLLYLSWLIANSAPSEASAEHSRPMSFVKAALFQWVNPKAWVMGSSAIAAYTTIDGDISLQLLIIVSIFGATTFVAVAVWMMFGKALQRILSDARSRRYFNTVMALLLVASVAPIVMAIVGG